MTHTQKAMAAKMLDHAWIYLAKYPIEQTRAAHDVLSEAERLVRNGFRAWPHTEWNNQIQTIFDLWPETKG